MKILFMHISRIPHMSRHGISLDLMRALRRNGHEVSVICAADEKTQTEVSKLTHEEGSSVVRVKIGENKKAGIVRKGLTTLFISRKYIKAINRYFSDIKFDLVLYPTPPVTIADAVSYVKRRDGAKSYLLLKDIFPQNAVDIGMMKTTGPKGFLYSYFRSVEKKLYAVSDYIGCMSPANREYILRHNPEVSSEKVEVCPNCIELLDRRSDQATKDDIKDSFGVPPYRKLFLYGGNLGKPQGIPFFIKCLESQADNDAIHFLIIGDGTEYKSIEQYIGRRQPGNVTLRRRLPNPEYERIVSAADVGLIFLDSRFTIPNFPSRSLSYMQSGIPMLCATDAVSDIGIIAEKNGFGFACSSERVEEFQDCCDRLLNSDLSQMGQRGRQYLEANYSVDKAYEIIARHFND